MIGVGFTLLLGSGRHPQSVTGETSGPTTRNDPQTPRPRAVRLAIIRAIEMFIAAPPRTSALVVSDSSSGSESSVNDSGRHRPLAERVPGALVVFEQSPPAKVLTGRRQREFHPARAELGMGALDVGAIEEQVGVGEAIRNRTTRFIGLSRAEDKQTGPDRVA